MRTLNSIEATTSNVTPNLFRFAPEPETTSSFESVKAGIQKAARGLSSALLTVGESTAFGSIDPQFQSMINLQLETQKQMMMVTMVSNIEKSKHETEMAPVRNIRVS